jgi:hypothetical protein
VSICALPSTRSIHAVPAAVLLHLSGTVALQLVGQQPADFRALHVAHTAPVVTPVLASDCVDIPLCPAASCLPLLLQLVGQLEEVEEEATETETEESMAAAPASGEPVAAPAACAAAAAAVSAAALAAAAIAGCDSDSGSSNRSDGSAVPVRSMPVPITQRKVRFVSPRF